MGKQTDSYSIPIALTPLLSPLPKLPGIGPKISQLICRAVGGDRVIDLLFHLPESLIDRRYRPQIKDAIPGKIATLKIQVTRVEKPKRPKQAWRIRVNDNTGCMELVFFSPWQARKMIPGSQLVISGMLEEFNGQLTMAHPHYIEPVENADAIPLIEPVWPLTAGLFPKNLAKAMRAAIHFIPDLPEWLDPEIVKKYQWPTFAEALRLLHFPGDFPELFANQSYEAAESRARSRLAFDELFADQMALCLARQNNRIQPGRALIAQDNLRQEALKRFGYELTNAQKQALAEIDDDLNRPYRMMRLLQGDVGSGKTIVALLAMLKAVEAGFQAVIMAPTEILARQHYDAFLKLAPTEVVFLSSSVKCVARREILAKLQDGRAKIAVGTHALFQEGVTFNNLALAIIDEQHRFGVEQRIKLGDKGENTDILVMAATPIPRTLLLTRWGEMQVSRIKEKPAGRKPIHTTLHSLAHMENIIKGIERALKAGSQIFWVCPLIAESEILDLAAAQDRYFSLCNYFGEDKIGIAHGQQETNVREQALDDFIQGKTRILVATTVIEVGVDVPNASIMVVEHAERFGLAQLHQLRGRVGRGQKQSFCLLLHEDKLNYTAKQRLSILRNTEDGFLIADEDFRLRGGGEITGHRQSGLPDFKLVDDIRLEQLLLPASQSAKAALEIMATNTEKHIAINSLLVLFKKYNVQKLLQSC